MLLMADQISKTSENLLWAQFVLVPIILGVFSLLGVKIANRAKNAEKNSKEAADFVRPNGTGHPTQTAMIEDVLLHMGEIRGDVRSFKEDFKTHTDQDTVNFTKVKNSMDEVCGLLNTLYDLHRDDDPPSD